jgi:histidyl-tRNA synthetase
MTVQATAISGFKEFLPEEQIHLERMKRIIAKHYELFGFAPIEVAAVEREEVLLSKTEGENTKQIYGIHLLKRSDQEHGESERKLALHFDLTVPLARYVAQNFGKLDFPFRRYQMQKVWRGERPQEGRFREFYQCDIDVIGDGELGLMHDAEMPLVIHGIFTELQVGKFIIRINNRKVHNGLLAHLGIPATYVDRKKGVPEADWDGSEEFECNTLALIDDMEKIGLEETKRLFREKVGATGDQIDKLFAVLTFKGSSDETLQFLASEDRGELFGQGVRELKEVVGHMASFGIPGDAFKVDLKVARGLDYYTGTVYETNLVHHESIGSVCSGGRFDDLASRFTDRKLPGVGISIGLTRLFTSLQKHKVIDTESGPKSTAKALIVQMHPDLRPDCYGLATTLRQAGIPCEVYLEDRKVDKQTKYGLKKRIPYVVFLDQKRKERGVCTVRHIDGGEQDVPLEKLAEHLR